ncbi:MAG: aminotransferase class I/II-fold pyridoxal phosphate-dependent enzyme, partial [Streptosporangiaceae bacterium]
YGDPRGIPVLRQALAGYLGRARGVLARPDQIVVCAGYAHALGLLTAVLAARGATELAFEDPSLWRHRDVAVRAGLAVRGVPVDDRGIVVGQIRGPAVVVTPAHQYPTGVTLEPARRAELADWARSTGGLVIEDDYDGEFRYDRQPVGAVQGLAPEHVAYAGTASKTLAPGLRLAWLALPEPLLAESGAALGQADAHAGVIDQLVLADLISSGGYDRHVRRSRIQYRARRDRLAAVLARQAPGITLRGIAAGLHALAELPAGSPGEAAAVALAQARGIAVEALGRNWISPGPHPQGLVIGYATPAAHAFEPALRGLAAVLAEVTPAGQPGSGPADSRPGEHHPMQVPKATEADRDFFRSLLPADPEVEVKPMFGNLGAFVHGNMFAGLLGTDVGVRLPDAARDELAAVEGSGPFGPDGRPMGGYLSLPAAWRSDPEAAAPWVAAALEHARSLPLKVKKQKRAAAD